MIENESDSNLENNELGLSTWGFRVKSVDLDLVGTRWDAEIQESVAPELQHFARAGVAAVAGSFLNGDPNGPLQDLFETDLHESITAGGFAGVGSGQLCKRGIAIIEATKAATDLQKSPYTSSNIDHEKTERVSAYCLPVTAGANIDYKFENVFQLRERFTPQWLGVIYEQRFSSVGLASPTGLVFAAGFSLNNTLSSSNSVFTALTFIDRPSDNKVDIQAGNRQTNDGIMLPSYVPDSNFSAARIFTSVINNSLQSFG